MTEQAALTDLHFILFKSSRLPDQWGVLVYCSTEKIARAVLDMIKPVSGWMLKYEMSMVERVPEDCVKDIDTGFRVAMCHPSQPVEFRPLHDITSKPLREIRVARALASNKKRKDEDVKEWAKTLAKDVAHLTD